MIRVTKSMTVNRPVEDVFQFLTEAGNLFKYSRSARTVRQLTEGPVGVGAQFEIISRFLGVRVPLRLEVVTFEPNRELASISISGPFKLRSLTRFESVPPSSTRLTFENEITPTGSWRILQSILPGIIRRNSEKEYAKLQELLSNTPASDDSKMNITEVSKTIVLVED